MRRSTLAPANPAVILSAKRPLLTLFLGLGLLAGPAVLGFGSLATAEEGKAEEAEAASASEETGAQEDYSPEVAKAGDCRFLEESFARLNENLNRRAINPRPGDLPLLMMFADLQRNLILLHNARGCETGKLVDVIRTGAATAGTQAAVAAMENATTPPQGAAPRAPAAVQVELEPVKEQMVTVKNANVRAGPDISTTKLGVVQKNGLVPVTGKVKGKNWYQVNLDGTIGYIFGELMRPKAELMREAIEDIRKKAKEGDPKSQYLLGNYYADAEKDMFEAVGWWQAAAEQGHAQAQYNLGVAYLRGKEGGGALPKNTDKARYWFEHSAEQGYEKAQRALQEMNAEEEAGG